MSKTFGIDRNLVAGMVIAAGIGIVSYSTYKVIRRSTSRGCRKTVIRKHETKEKLREYLLLHYELPNLNDALNVGTLEKHNFPKKCAEICLLHWRKRAGIPSRALDVGCAVGRASFELTDGFDEVVGLDCSSTFINACNSLREKGCLSYSAIKEGLLEIPFEAKISDSLHRFNTVFMQADACNLPFDLGQFGCVLASNLLCYLYNPRTFLDRVINLVATEGVLVIASPYCFNTEYTKKKHWIGGFINEHDEEITGFDGLKQHLEPFFDLEAEENIPFSRRQSERSYKSYLSHVTVWRRKTS